MHIQSAAASHGTYSSFSFLSDNTVVLANEKFNRLDLCHIPTAVSSRCPQKLHVTLSLDLPKLAEDVVLLHMRCDSSPFSSRYGPSAPDSADWNHLPPFETSWSNAIIAFGFLYTNGDTYPFYRLVAHRRSLLQLLLATDPPGTDTNRSRVNEPKNSTKMAWTAWGPSRTRWLDFIRDQDDNTHYIYGQRLLCFNAECYDIPGEQQHIEVFDFNVENVLASDNAITSSDFQLDKDSLYVFAEPVLSELPYVIILSPKRYSGYGVWMDESRIFVQQASLFRIFPNEHAELI